MIIGNSKSSWLSAYAISTKIKHYFLSSFLANEKHATAFIFNLLERTPYNPRKKGHFLKVEPILQCMQGNR